jgi:hypothetical protein
MNANDEQRRVIRALLRKVFPQQDLLGPAQFQDLARKRGLLITTEALETWDRLGILTPIIKVRCPFNNHLVTERLPDGTIRYHPFPLDREPRKGEDVVKVYESWSSGPEELREWLNRWDDLVICPSRETFKPWSELREDSAETVSIFYHPYQIFRLQDLHQTCQLTLLVPSLVLDHEACHRWEEWQRDRLEQSLAQMRLTVSSFLRELGLLFSIEDRYLPQVRGKFTFYGFHPEGIKDWYQWAETFCPETILKENGLTVGEVKRFRVELAERGKDIDPCFAWYVLIRHVAYDLRQRLGKEALLAWDYYEVAEMLGRFLGDVMGERQPHVDDLVSWGGDWKKDIYGVSREDFDYNKGNAMPGILRHFGLDPRFKLLLVVEGPSEIAFVERWCELKGISLRSFKIRLIPLEGVPHLKNPRTRQYLKDAREEGAIAVVAVDDEQDAAEQLRNWVQDQLIERVFEISELNHPETRPFGGMLWKPCFEDSNFTYSELLEAWMATININEGKRAVDEEVLRRALKGVRECDPNLTVIKSIETVARQHHIRFRKPEIAKKLAEKFCDSDKAIVLLLQKVIRVARFARRGRYRPGQGSNGEASK